MKALVTGGSRGIGAAIADKLSEVGMTVYTPSRKFSGHNLQYPAEIERAWKDFGPVDVLVNNVGGGGRWGTLQYESTAEDVWFDCLAVNLESAIKLTNKALPYMLKQQWGRIVTIASIHGMEAGGRPWFMAAKAAQIAAMKSYSKNKLYVRNGITFNTVCPGHVLVEGKPSVDSEGFPMGRMGKPEEVANLVRWLCSNEAAWVNGATIPVDGGESNSL